METHIATHRNVLTLNHSADRSAQNSPVRVNALERRQNDDSAKNLVLYLSVKISVHLWQNAFAFLVHSRYQSQLTASSLSTQPDHFLSTTTKFKMAQPRIYSDLHR